jgi:hypothetical protein
MLHRPSQRTYRYASDTVLDLVHQLAALETVASELEYLTLLIFNVIRDDDEGESCRVSRVQLRVFRTLNCTRKACQCLVCLQIAGPDGILDPRHQPSWQSFWKERKGYPGPF